MPDTDLTHLTKDADHFGVNVARTIRVISKLLLDWSLAERARRVSYSTIGELDNKSSKDLPFLTAIYFDKLATFYCRLWNRLHYDRQVRYRAAFSQRRGFHGPGQSLKIDRPADDNIGMGRYYDDNRYSPYAFTTEVVEKLKPGIGNARLLFRLDGEPWTSECKVHPQLEETAWESWCFGEKDESDEALFLNRKELAFTSVISTAIASLSKEELRAVGTHCSASETCMDIEFNLTAWKRDSDFILKAIEENSDQGIESSSRRLAVTSREVKRKSIDNRGEYVNALTKLIQHLSTEQVVLSSFKAVQNDDVQIWQNARVLQYAIIAPTLLDFSLYYRRVLSILGKIHRLEDREVKETNDHMTDLKHWCEQKGLILIDYEDVKSKIDSEVIVTLRKVKEQILLQMPEDEDIRDAGIS